MIRNLLGFSRPYWRSFVVGMLLTGFSAVIGLAVPFVVRYYVDRVLPSGDTRMLGWLLLGLVTVTAANSLSGYVSSIVLVRFSENIIKDIQVTLFTHIQDLGMAFHSSARTGDLISRVVSDTAQLQMVLGSPALGLISSVITLAAGAVVMFLLHWKLALVSLLALPLFTYFAGFFSKRIRRRSRKLQESNAERMQTLAQAFYGIREMKTLGVENEFRLRFRSRVADLVRSVVDLVKSISAYKGITGFVGGIGPVVVLWFGGREVMAGSVSLGTLLAFSAVLVYVFTSARSIIHLYGDVQIARASFGRISEILSLPTETDCCGKVQPVSVKGHVEFHEVAFSYDTGRSVLRGLSLEIEANECVAIVGASGAGKTTLVNLLLGFYKPQRGHVYLDGIDVRDLDRGVLRRFFGVVPQEPFLFPESIKQNILYGRLDATEEEVVEAARIANIHSFIAAIPEGYNARIGEKGLRVSGGEKQRIAIARAVLRNPRILIFDEATSEIDQHSEELIRDALGEIVKNRTTIIITHRPSMLALASRIAVLDNGEIVACGTHNELSDCCPAYANLLAHGAEVQVGPKREHSLSSFRRGQGEE